MAPEAPTEGAGKANPKPNEPTQVREADNTRPPGEPTPQRPEKPVSMGAEQADEPDAE